MWEEEHKCPRRRHPRTTSGSTGFDHFGVPVADRARAEAFYGEMLGFPVLFRRGMTQAEIDRGFMPGTFFNVVGHPIAVFLAHEPLSPVADLRGCPAYGLETLSAGLERIVGRLRAAGIAFEGPTEQGSDAPLARCIWVNDPDGDHLQIGTTGGTARGPGAAALGSRHRWGQSPGDRVH